MNPVPGGTKTRGLIGRCGLFCGGCVVYAESHETVLDERRRCGRPLVYSGEECAYCRVTETA